MQFPECECYNEQKKQIKIIIMLVGTVTLAFSLPLSEQPFNSTQFLGSQKHEKPEKNTYIFTTAHARTLTNYY